MNPLSLLLRGLPLAEAGGASILSPSALAGRFLWHEPSLTVDFTDAARTALVAADGDPVGGETDQSGAGNHITQATSTKRPLFKQYTVNGKTFWSTLFDGVDDYLGCATPASGPAATGKVLICAAARWASFASGRTLAHVGTEVNNQAVELICNSGGTGLNFDPYGFGNICQFGAMATGQYYVVTGYYDGAQMVARLNGVEVARVTRALALGSNIAQVGAVSSSTVYHSGDCPFLVMANVIPSASDIAALERYAGSKVGVAF